MDPRVQPGFLGTGASLLSDLSLLAYLLLIIPGMLLGFWFARRGRHRPEHKWTMIVITAVNWLLILFLMLASYTFDVDDHIFQQPDNMRYLIPTIHGLFGLPAQLLATYIIYRMLREDAQVAAAKAHGVTGRDLERHWFKGAKPAMRLTLTLWLVTAAFGVITYLVRYDVVPVSSLGAQNLPAATPEVTPNVTPEVTAETTAKTVDAPALTPELERAADPVQTPEISASSAALPVQTPELVPDPEPDPDPDPEPDDDDDDDRD